MDFISIRRRPAPPVCRPGTQSSRRAASVPSALAGAVGDALRASSPRQTWRAPAALLLATTVLFGGVVSTPARAVDTWRGTTSSNWFDGTNWLDGTVPVAADNVDINAGTLHPPLISGGTAFAGDITIGRVATGSLAINGGGILNSLNSRVGNDAGAQGDVTVDGVGSNWAIDGFLYIGNAGTGSLDVTHGAVVNTHIVSLGGEGTGQGTTTVDGAGSSLAVSQQLYVGNLGAGLLTIGNGGAVSSATALIGREGTGTGEALIDGVGSSWTNSGDFSVGGVGTGTLTIQGGGVASVGNGYIGASGGSNGMVQVSGAGSTWTVRGLFVGYYGTGTLAIQGSGKVSNVFDTYIGFDGMGDGTVLVDGTGSSLASHEFYVGYHGNGQLTISNGGSVSAASSLVGGSVDSVGTVLVKGHDSNWTTSGGLIVGSDGSGTLTIQDSGTVWAGGTGFIALNGGTGTVLVDGAGSSLTYDSILAIGRSGTGLLTVRNGAKVSVTNGQVGYNAGSDGTVLVDGAGSSWTGSEGFYIGIDSRGALTVRNGGASSSDYAYLGVFAGGTGAIQVDGTGSSWTNGSELHVGYDGTGQLTISHGGSVSDMLVSIGTDAGSTGTVRVDGAGSNWNNSSDLYVGRLGAATLTVANGGAVNTAGQTVVAEEAGSTGTLNIGAAAGDPAADAGAFTASSVAFGEGTGTLNFNHTANDYVFAPALLGNGAVNVLAGTTTITGAGSNTGTTHVNGGTLRVDGSLGDTTTTVFDTATLGGSGRIDGDVTVLDGGTIAPGSSAGTLTVGSLTLDEGAILDYELGQHGVIGGGVNDLIEVGGDLTLDGTLDITDIGGFGAGAYRLMNYGGTLTDHTLELGTLPAGVGAGDLYVQTAIGGQVNLLSSAGLALAFWDGQAAGAQDNGAIDGGDGIWVAGNRNWTQADGAINGQWEDGGFAVFGGAGGTVDVAGKQAVAGLQFMSDYVLTAAPDGELDIGDVAANIRVDPDVTAIVDVPIGGSGVLVKQDAGTLVLAAANTYSGGTMLRGGTVSVAQDASLGAAGGALGFDGGTLRNTAAFDTARTVALAAGGGTFQADAALGLDGVVSGAGMLTKDGTGTLTLTGDNTYEGGTRVLAGTLAGDATSIRGDLANHATVVFDQAVDATFDGAISGDGDMVKRGSGVLTLGGTSALDWTIDSGALIARPTQFSGNAAVADGASLRFADAGGSYAGTLTGAGRFEIAGGDTAFALTGDSSGFAGDTRLQSGTLRMDGSLGGQTHVAGGAMLTGTGTLGSVDNAGVVAAGNSIGTLTLSGDYVHRDGAVLQAEIGPGGESDLLDVAGSATIEGGSVDVIKAPGQYVDGTRYTLIDAAGGVTGTFDTLDQNLPFLGLLLDYDANHVYLDVQRNDVGFDIVCGNGTFNQCQVAGALDRIADQPDVTPDLQAALAAVTTLDLPDAQAAFDHLSGEAHGSLAGILLEGHALYGQAVSRRIAERREATGGERLQGGAWARAYGASNNLDGDGNAHAADFGQRGLAAGFDVWGSDRWLVGASFNLMQVDADFRPGDHGEADAKNASLYASVRGGHAWLDAVASFAWWDNDVARRVEVGDIAREARSEYGGHRLATHLEAGWTFALGRTQQLAPSVSVDYAKLGQQGFHEQGAQDLDLIGRAQDVERTTVSAGLRWTAAFNRGEWTLEPMLQARWLHAFGDRYAEQAVAFAGAPGVGYRVRGVSWPRDRGLLGAGLQWHRGDRLEMFIDVDYQKGGGLESKNVGAGLRWRW